MFHGSVHLLTVAFTFTTRRPLSIHRSIVQLGDSCFHPSLHMSHSVCDDSSSTSRLTACSGLDLTRVFLIAQSSDFLDHDESPLHPPASHYHPSDSRGASAGFEPTPLEKTSSVPTITPRGLVGEGVRSGRGTQESCHGRRGTEGVFSPWWRMVDDSPVHHVKGLKPGAQNLCNFCFVRSRVFIPVRSPWLTTTSDTFRAPLSLTHRCTSTRHSCPR